MIPAMRLFAVLALLALLAMPVIAADYTLTGYQELNVLDVEKLYYTGETDVSFDQSADDKAITLIHFKVPQDHTITYTLYYGTGSSVSGYATNIADYSLWPTTTTTSTISLDGVSKSYSYFDTNPEYDYYLSGYARTHAGNQTGLIVYSAGYGSLDNDLAVFKEVPNLETNLIYRVDLHCDTPFDADISYGSKQEVAKSVSKDILQVINEWVDLAMQMAETIAGVITSGFRWLKFFFIDNLGMTVSLYIAGSLAIAARTSRGNPIRVLKQFFKDQKALFTFIIEMWGRIVELLANIRGIFRI